MPVIFVGHGSPMNALLDNDFTHALAAFGRVLPKPTAILVISAHWFVKETSVTCSDRPETIYDFWGFPEELYEISYSCPGAPELGARVSDLIMAADVRCDYQWGLDHGAWTILKHLFPEADIPTLQLSIDYSKDPRFHYNLAKQLAPLRKEGVLILGSGNLVHNLRIIDYDVYAPPRDWAQEIDTQIKEALLAGDHETLINYSSLGRYANLAIPTEDHYLPMLYTIALQGAEDQLTFIYEGIQHGTVSMRCFKIESSNHFEG
ncbi:MAG: 4,5-DOPA dioxygenase extradiol [Candidatus Thorarchaeota archaeon]